ncbi:MAG: hypothetical protein GX909_06560 [Clostridiaceae bacterium]|nr:hypothetical protein [Clostridiaceae bacterium]
MKLNIVNMDLDEFTEALDRCKGQVWIVSDEGDKINLRSKLSQLVGISHIIKGATLTDVDLICELKEDERTLINFLMYG